MTTAKNIYLIGFSGTGKTVSGNLAAMELGWAFVDTDELIEQRAGKRIPEMFAEDGEKRFREIENGVLLDVSSGERQVVSTGGGAPVNVSNRQLMRRTGMIVRLTASPEVIHQRLSKGSKRNRPLRPLLVSNTPIDRIRKLLSQRESAYSHADVTITTDGREHANVALDIAHAWHRFAQKHGYE